MQALLDGLGILNGCDVAGRNRDLVVGKARQGFEHVGEDIGEVSKETVEYGVLVTIVGAICVSAWAAAARGPWPVSPGRRR